MKLYTIYAVFLIAASVQAVQRYEKEKRLAQGYSATTAAPVYATSAAPAYSQKLASKINYVSQPINYEQQQLTIQQQQPIKLAYSQPQNTKLTGAGAADAAAYAVPQQQFSYSFEVQPQLKLALQQGLKYNLGQNAQVKYVQPDLKYVALQHVQPEVKYVQPEVKYIPQQVKYIPQQVKYVQPQQEVKYVSQPAVEAKAALGKINYPSQAAVAYSQQPAQPNYSPANAVSSFSFSNPHVTYSNLGLLSQVIGKAYAAPQTVPQHVTYFQQPQTQTQTHQQYVHAQPAQSAQPVKYVSTQQGQQATQQVIYVPQAYTQKQNQQDITYA